MNMDRLKQLNKPENLLEEYQVKLNLYAIPPDTLESLSASISENTRRQVSIQQQIDQLPAWKHIDEILIPAFGKMVSAVSADNDRIENEIQTDIQQELTASRNYITEQLEKHDQILVQEFQKQDLKPMVQKLKWMGGGFLVSTIIYLLITALRIMLVSA